MVNVRRAAAAAAAVVLALTVAPAAAGAAPVAGGGASCDYLFTAWPGGFTADVVLVNDGHEAIDGWTVDLSFDIPSTLGSAWNSGMTQPDPFSMAAQPAAWNRVIPPGGAVTFGWVAFAASHEIPVMSLNGVPC